MQGHYVGKGKATGKSVRTAVAHILEISDGKIVRFDRCPGDRLVALYRRPGGPS